MVCKGMKHNKAVKHRALRALDLASLGRLRQGYELAITKRYL